MKDSSLIKDLMNFLDLSPTAWHAVLEARDLLLKAGFAEISEKDIGISNRVNAILSYAMALQFVLLSHQKNSLKNCVYLHHIQIAPALNLNLSLKFAHMVQFCLVLKFMARPCSVHG